MQCFCVQLLSCLRSKSELWATRALVKDDVLALEEDVAVDSEPDASIRLDATEAFCRTY